MNLHELLPLFVVRLIFTFGPWRTTKGTRSLATPLTNSVHSPNEAPVDCNLPINGQLREFRPIGGYQAKKQNKTSQKDDEGREWKSDSHLKDGEERERGRERTKNGGHCHERGHPGQVRETPRGCFCKDLEDPGAMFHFLSGEGLSPSMALPGPCYSAGATRAPPPRRPPRQSPRRQPLGFQLESPLSSAMHARRLCADQKTVDSLCAHSPFPRKKK